MADWIMNHLKLRPYQVAAIELFRTLYSDKEGQFLAKLVQDRRPPWNPNEPPKLITRMVRNALDQLA